MGVPTESAFCSICSAVAKCIAGSVRSFCWIAATSVVPSVLPPSSDNAARIRFTSSSPSWCSSAGVFGSEVWMRISFSYVASPPGIDTSPGRSSERAAGSTWVWRNVR